MLSPAKDSLDIDLRVNQSIERYCQIHSFSNHFERN